MIFIFCKLKTSKTWISFFVSLQNFKKRDFHLLQDEKPLKHDFHLLQAKKLYNAMIPL
eukprot:UN22694